MPGTGWYLHLIIPFLQFKAEEMGQFRIEEEEGGVEQSVRVNFWQWKEGRKDESLIRSDKVQELGESWNSKDVDKWRLKVRA